MDASIRPRNLPEELSGFLRELSAAVRKLGIYPPGHPASVRAAEKPFALLEELLESGERIIFATAEGKLLGNGSPLDDRLLNDGLGKVILESGLSSVSFEPGLSFAAFEKFLAAINLKKEQRDLSKFIEVERLQGISIGKVQYQLVGEDERVVSADVADTISDGIAGDVQATISQALKKHPELLLQILNRRGNIADAGSGTERAGGAGDMSAFEPSSRSAVVGMSAGSDSQPTRDSIRGALSEYSNEELVSLLVAALRQDLGEHKATSRAAMAETLFSLKELLAEREAIDLLPQLQQSLGELNLLDPHYLELIFAADSSPRKVAHAEIQEIKKDFAAGTIAPERLDDLQGWLTTFDDQQYTQEVVGSFYHDAEAQHFKLTESQLATLVRMASQCAQDLGSTLAQAQLQQIRDRIGDPSLNLDTFTALSAQLELYFNRALQQGDYTLASDLLYLVCQKFDTEITYAAGVADEAARVHQRLTSSQHTELLVTRLSHNFEGLSKAMTPLLEKFHSLEAILVLASRIADDNRGVRVLLIRLISGFGERALRAFRLLLSDRTLTQRPAGHAEVSRETWYRLRNIIFILGNIRHPDSVALVKQFVEDRDTRVVLESLKALERLGGDEAAQISAHLLYHADREVQMRALHNLVTSGAIEHYPLVEEFFIRNRDERLNSMAALIKLDSQRAFDFLSSVLLGESEIFNKFHTKPDEELNETIVSTLIQLRSPAYDEAMRKYVRSQTRSLLGHLRKADSVKIAEKYLRTTSRGL